MADKKTQAGFEFLVAALKANKDAPYAELREKAESKGHTVFPIMYGRAKAVLGLVKSKPRATKASKAAKKAEKGKAPKAQAAPKRGRPLGGGDSKSGRIRELLKSGMTAADIAKRVGCTVGLVYNVKSSMGKTGAPKRGPGRPRKVVSASAGAVASGLEGVIEALKSGERQRAELTRALDRIRAVLAEVG